MNTRFWLTALKDNWYLLAAMAICVGAFAYKVAVSGEEAQVEPVERTYARVRTGGPRSSLSTLQRTKADPHKGARQVIESHRAKLEENPRAEEAPAYLNAMGNLYVQKFSDYEEAARCYETLLSDYPESGNVRAACIHLANCYERLEDTQKARRVYRRMMDLFPAHSQEYQYADAMMHEGMIPES